MNDSSSLLGMAVLAAGAYFLAQKNKPVGSPVLAQALQTVKRGDLHECSYGELQQVQEEVERLMVLRRMEGERIANP